MCGSDISWSVSIPIQELIDRQNAEDGTDSALWLWDSLSSPVTSSLNFIILLTLCTGGACLLYFDLDCYKLLLAEQGIQPTSTALDKVFS